jgi:predicted nucleic acid-binding Zn finger protein
MSGSRVDGAVGAGVRQLLFHPSGKQIWIVVGKDDEYWTDLELGFCSCKDFYFVSLSGGKECYHLRSVRKAAKEGGIIVMDFGDAEYVQMLHALAEDHANRLSLR